MTTAIPGCARSCLQDAINRVGCRDLEDTACYCTQKNQQAMNSDSTAIACILGACTSEELSTIVFSLALVCLGVGSNPFTAFTAFPTFPTAGFTVPTVESRPTSTGRETGNQDNQSSGKGLSAGAKGGIAASVIISAILLLGAIFLYLRSRRISKLAPAPPTTGMAPAPAPVDPLPPSPAPVSSQKTFLPISVLGPTIPPQRPQVVEVNLPPAAQTHMPHPPQQSYITAINASAGHELATTTPQTAPAELGVGNVFPGVYELTAVQQMHMASELEGSGRPPQRLA